MKKSGNLSEIMDNNTKKNIRKRALEDISEVFQLFLEGGEAQMEKMNELIYHARRLYANEYEEEVKNIYMEVAKIFVSQGFDAVRKFLVDQDGEESVRGIENPGEMH